MSEPAKSRIIYFFLFFKRSQNGKVLVLLRVATTLSIEFHRKFEISYTNLVWIGFEHTDTSNETLKEEKEKKKYDEIPFRATSNNAVCNKISGDAKESGGRGSGSNEKKEISDERFLLVHSGAGGHIRIVIDIDVVVVVHVLMISGDGSSSSSNKRNHRK